MLQILSLIVLGLGATALMVTAVLHERRRIPQKRARFEGREVIGFDFIFEQYFRSKGIGKDRASFLWDKLARTLGLDPGKLRPGDRFAVELAPARGHLTPDELGDLLEFTKAEWERMGFKGTIPRIDTLEDFICALSVPRVSEHSG